MTDINTKVLAERWLAISTKLDEAEAAIDRYKETLASLRKLMTELREEQHGLEVVLGLTPDDRP